jgi:serine/threonine protein kinase
MSPEQVRADADLDGRSDIYALGVILFEMLTGRGPFQANTPMSVALKHLTDPLPSIRIFRPDLPIELESILGTAMAKDREERYVSASELASELRALPGIARDEGVHAKARVVPNRSEEISTEVDMPDDTGISSSPFDSQPVSNPTARDVDESNSMSSPPRQATVTNKPINRTLQIVTLAGIAVFLLFVCGSMGVLGTWAGLVLPGMFPGQAVRATTTATRTVTPQEIILFSDDFTNPESGWPSDQTLNSEYGYQSNSYRIFAIGNGSVPWVSRDGVYDNVSLYVDATPISGNANGYYGLLCRIRNDQNFYYFVLGNDGSYDIGKFKDGEARSLFPDTVRYSDAINRGNQTNRIKADCMGNTLRLYANDVFLDQATDTDFSSGVSGMSVSALDPEGFEVIFDNFLITTTNQ